MLEITQPSTNYCHRCRNVRSTTIRYEGVIIECCWLLVAEEEEELRRIYDCDKEEREIFPLTLACWVGMGLRTCGSHSSIHRSASVICQITALAKVDYG